MAAILPRGTPLPPARPGTRYVAITWLGVVVADDRLRRRVDRIFHWPMIVLALLCLPLLVADVFILHQRPDLQWTWLWWVTVVGLVVTWIGFTVEFVVKIAIAECRIEYVKRNWIDIVIIALPALRPLRVAAVARSSRALTLRSVMMKSVRYVVTILIGMEATDRMRRRLGVGRRNRRDPRQMTRHELIDEVRRLRSAVERWGDWVEAHDRFLAERGINLHEPPPPTPPDPAAGGDSRIAARENRPRPARPDDR